MSCSARPLAICPITLSRIATWNQSSQCSDSGLRYSATPSRRPHRRTGRSPADWPGVLVTSSVRTTAASIRTWCCHRSPKSYSYKKRWRAFQTGARKSRGVVHLIGWAASWNTILSPKLTISTFGFGGFTRCSGGAFSYDPTAPWAIFVSSCRSALTGGLPSPSLSHPQEELRGATGAVRPSPVARRARRSASEESAVFFGDELHTQPFVVEHIHHVFH